MTTNVAEATTPHPEATRRAKQPCCNRTSISCVVFSDLDTIADVSGLGLAVDQYGLDAFPAAIQELARRGREVAPVAADILGDVREPLAARERAFARVCLAVTRAMKASG